MDNEEKIENETIESGKKPRVKKSPIASVSPTIADKIKALHERGLDHNRIAAILMIQKSLVKEVLG